ncbi:coenzyme F420 hydrogenase [Virgibacillus halodenitrificans]|uniref:Coenzyme F420 hydrogenase n=1 Tax=Virgibacillus halodenitrificans TaxID=1482 RepID=A0AAC9NLJ6_VIRHA|nr:Coenzyme F420 hydrogenase/dehydrogenase, beta subunit C-terminal domain [Virgibacillus halodenitrificans]APC49612.1 coenzyme F420 hydrogenase [Virgibacillus halodenitrificans]
MNGKIKELMDTVVKNDYCIGCGLCASLTDSPLTMMLNEDGKYQPYLSDNNHNKDLEISVLSICPFAKNNNKETEIGKKIFEEENNVEFDEYAGYYIKNYAGYVKEEEFRSKGSSGGMGNWIATQLLKNDLVDGIIHVKSSPDDNNLLFDFQISDTVDELLKGAKSKYYPVEMSKVLQFVKENEGRYALIGIPCYIKGVRLLAEQDKIINERIKFFIGLVCGHLKSDMFAKSMGWQLGIEPDKLNGIDFRKKLDDRAANNYGVEVKGEKDGKEVVLISPTKELYTTNWGQGMFKYNACEFCDDVLAETADVTVGDAWLPEYSKDSMGTNVIVVRNAIIQQIFEDNMGDAIHIEELSSEKVYQSQAGGFRHRRDGLSYRLYLKDQNKEWRPNKRVEPSNKHSSKRKRIYEKRTFLSQESFKAYKLAEKNRDFDEFINYMDPLIKNYNKMNAPSIARRVLRKVKRAAKKLIES